MPSFEENEVASHKLMPLLLSRDALYFICHGPETLGGRFTLPWGRWRFYLLAGNVKLFKQCVTAR